MVYIAVAIVVTLLCWLIIRTQNWHGQHSFDYVDGVQKVHVGQVPRVGGIAIFLGLATAPLWTKADLSMLTYVMISSIPVFLAGLGDDLTKSISHRLRFLFALISAFIFVWWTGYVVQSVSTPIVEWLFDWRPLALVITVVAIAGIVNSINLIDGMNGLASGTVTILFVTIMLIAWRTHDTKLVIYAGIHVAAVLGFLIWNFPRARLFLGDGGAYYLGFALATGTIMLIQRNHDVSPWTVLLVLAYPIDETLFSIFRRWGRRGSSPQVADNVHLHHLARRSIARPLAKRKKLDEQWVNPLTSLIMMVFPLMSCGLALLANELTPYLSLTFYVIFTAFYVYVYRRLSRIYVRLRPRSKA